MASEHSDNSSTSGADRPFVHLHLHSEYSLLDGGNRLDKLIARVKELGMDAVAVTDHGNMHAAVSFYRQARAADVKPILGVEAYVAPGDRKDRTYTGVQDGGYHLVLLAENNAGWDNLLYLCSEAYLTGFYYKPRMDREILETHGEGLIAINGHLGSELAFHLRKYEETKDKAHWGRAVEVCEWHRNVFAPCKPTDPDRWASCGALNKDGLLPRFFVELQHHVIEQVSINPHLIRLARELDLPLVCDNDSHFLLEEDHDAHDTLICISTGKVKDDPDRMRYTPELYVKSPEQMWDLFDTPEYNNDEIGEAGREALLNTRAIADRCDVELPIGANHAPVVVVKAPAKSKLPKHTAKQYAGDLTAWFKDYCSRFELEPANDPSLDQTSLKKDCDKALRLLAEAGMVWRYGPGIMDHRHKEIEGESAPPSPTGELSAQPTEGVLPKTPSDRSAATSPVGDGGGEVDVDAWMKWARLNRELKILADKLISAYFLICWDFVNWGRQRGIPANARGSGVGTMVGYALGLSNACPVQYGLLFERFTDPDRAEYPDIDIDLCQDGRGEVINYVREKYGHVAQIITFGTLKARAAIRDVCRVHEVSLAEADKLAKLVPEELKITIDKALEAEPELKKWYDSDERVKRVLDTGRVLEGQARHASVHAAGVIVATQPLHQIVPLYKHSGSDDIITQWDGPTCEMMGLLKMDFLGLRTLSTIERCKQIIRDTLPERAIWKAVGRTQEAHGSKSVGLTHPLDLDRLTYDDPNVFALFQRGDTTGVFQFESGGMRRLLLDMKPDRLEDLIAANALFRPGPMDLIPDYNKRKHGQAPVPKVHPIVDKFTGPTYGVMVYQEQVMQIVHELGGIPLRSAYTLIKAISKKKAKVINANRPKFIEGAGEKGLSKKDAEELFDLILKFAGYGFNKSHSTGYSIIAYQTAYLKTYFPAQYMAAFLSFESQAQKVADWLPYLDDCKKTVVLEVEATERRSDVATKGGESEGGPSGSEGSVFPVFAVLKKGIEVRPPDINLSQSDFSVVFDEDEPHSAAGGHIRFGLKAIKGAGAKAIEAIVKERSDGATERRSDEGSQSRAGHDGPPSVATSLRHSVASPFSSLFDFAERVPPGTVNKATIEALIKAGAFDSVYSRDRRSAMVASIEQAVAAGQRAAQDKACGQNQLFGSGGGFGGDDEPAAETDETPLAHAEPWPEAEMLRQEKETVGFYISSHPLDEWSDWTAVFSRLTCADLKDQPQKQKVELPAMVQSVRTIVVKTGRSVGQKMGILTLEDTTGTAEAVLFTDEFSKYGHMLYKEGGAEQADCPIFVVGEVDHSRGDPQIIVKELVPIDGQPRVDGTLMITLRDRLLNGSSGRALGETKRLLDLYQPEATEADRVTDERVARPVPFDLLVETDRAFVRLSLQSKPRVRLSPELVQGLCGFLGHNSVCLFGGKSAVKKDKDRGRGRR